MVAIDSALQVDLTGQICSDSIGNQFYSGIGGQVDFLRWASRSRTRKPIIAISSTAKGGTFREFPLCWVLVCSDSLEAVRYLVTEHGVAYPHGKSIRELAKALIEIADPRFRQLYEYCGKTKWLQRPQPWSDRATDVILTS